MYKKTITYTNFLGETITNDFYFNLSRAELVRLETTTKGGYMSRLESIIKERNVEEFFEIYDDLIRRSYGKKSPDGRQFVKRPEFLEEFIGCGAYDALYMDLMAGDDDPAIEFIRGIMPDVPPEVMEEARKEAEALTGSVITLPSGG